MSVTRARPTSRAVKVRHPTRGHYEHETIVAILRATPFVHVGFVDRGRPFVLPMLHAVVDDHVVLHGLTASRAMKVMATDAEVCVTATILDGLVLARSATNSSANYRSAVVLGRPEPVTDPAEFLHVLDALTDGLLPGRREHLRPPTEKDLATVAMVRIPLVEASAKIRTGGPGDAELDGDWPVWAGVVPYTTTAGAPVPADDLREDLTDVPPHVAAMVGRPFGG